ncbi:LuxR C-terminal-related transcriptional regulator [Hymenobacter ruricola]|uniref:Response regulator transcription factor n=1 Tax=Hymenobacter ruricola TaxID=2791023 RepID=A0ABS0I6G2_9BACT|nr:response regulator transcription factor [Hymenobacter ruricola]MBF9222530.1 response regulator transcription factor [Hymenobacter ruricola]
MQTPPLALAIIEDQAPIREALNEYLCAQPEFHCVLVARSMEDFLNRLPGVATPPALVLSDIGLPGRSGIEGLPVLLERLPAAQVLMLSVFTDAERVFEAICAGAAGYLVKSTPLPQLKQHLLEVAAGGSPMSPGVARFVLQAFRAQPPVRVAAAPENRLSPREQEVVQGVEEGLGYKVIAARLGISPDTVNNHVRAIYRKLQVNSKSELLARSLKQRGPGGGMA